MLSTILLTPDSIAAEAVGQLLAEPGVFEIIKESPMASVHEIVRLCRTHDPYLVLIDCSDPEQACYIANQIRHYEGLRAAVVGFSPSWTPAEKRQFDAAGISHMLRSPFSWADLELAAYEAIHERRPVDASKVLAFLPAKAGGGASTVALQTAAAFANELGKKVVLIDSDRRSGIISLLLDLEKRASLARALERAGELTPIEWRKQVVTTMGIDLLLADPSAKTSLSSWGDYYQLLSFVVTQYDAVIVDLPELVNPATAEVVRSAGYVFVVCTPEVPSLKLARHRCAELAAWGAPDRNVHILMNRWVAGGLTLDAIAKLIGREVFTTIPNDYASIQRAILSSSLAGPNSAFAKGCLRLARKAAGLEPASSDWFRLPFRRK
jgi:pilus assembly protein CpaE